MSDGRLSMVGSALKSLWRPTWGKLCYLAGAFSIVSEIAYQSLSDEYAAKIPRFYNIVVWIAVQVPWWGFCIIGFLILFAAFFELVHSLRLDVAAAKDRESRMASAYAISMGEITKKFHERINEANTKIATLERQSKGD